jgi:type I restriction-modification system DNA methylase subunit
LAKKKEQKEASKPVNYTLYNQKITFEFLKAHLWSAADILRGSLDPSDYRQPIMTLLFVKRQNDTFEENAEKLIKGGKSEKEAYENKNRHSFFIPKEARWSVLSKVSENIGENIDHVCRLIERENPDLDGVLFRGNEEEKIRENMIKEDIIEGIIALPPKLFYGTGIPGCVLILNRNKPPNRKNKIILIYAAKDFEEGKVRNKLRGSDIQKIVSAFKNYKDIDRYCHIAEFDELQENEFNLNVPRFVDISEADEEIDIQSTIDELKKIEKEKEQLEIQVNADLKELGFKV